MKKTTAKQRARLAQFGFVRVDGLCPHSFIFGFKPPLCASPFLLGRYGQKGGKVVLITKDGEIWLSAAEGNKVPDNFVRELCPNGEGAEVPCLSYHNELRLMDILNRLVDPDCRPDDLKELFLKKSKI